MPRGETFKEFKEAQERKQSKGLREFFQRGKGVASTFKLYAKKRSLEREVLEKLTERISREDELKAKKVAKLLVDKALYRDEKSREVVDNSEKALEVAEKLAKALDYSSGGKRLDLFAEVVEKGELEQAELTAELLGKVPLGVAESLIRENPHFSPSWIDKAFVEGVGEVWETLKKHLWHKEGLAKGALAAFLANISSSEELTGFLRPLFQEIVRKDDSTSVPNYPYKVLKEIAEILLHKEWYSFRVFSTLREVVEASSPEEMGWALKAFRGFMEVARSQEDIERYWKPIFKASSAYISISDSQYLLAVLYKGFEEGAINQSILPLINEIVEIGPEGEAPDALQALYRIAEHLRDKGENRISATADKLFEDPDRLRLFLQSSTHTKKVLSMPSKFLIKALEPLSTKEKESSKESIVPKLYKTLISMKALNALIHKEKVSNLEEFIEKRWLPAIEAIESSPTDDVVKIHALNFLKEYANRTLVNEDDISSDLGRNLTEIAEAALQHSTEETLRHMVYFLKRWFRLGWMADKRIHKGDIVKIEEALSELIHSTPRRYWANVIDSVTTILLTATPSPLELAAGHTKGKQSLSHYIENHWMPFFKGILSGVRNLPQEEKREVLSATLTALQGITAPSSTTSAQALSEEFGKALVDAVLLTLPHRKTKKDLLHLLKYFIQRIPEKENPATYLRRYWPLLLKGVANDEESLAHIYPRAVEALTVFISKLPQQADIVEHVKRYWKPFFKGVVKAPLDPLISTKEFQKEFEVTEAVFQLTAKYLQKTSAFQHLTGELGEKLREVVEVMMEKEGSNPNTAPLYTILSVFGHPYPLYFLLEKTKVLWATYGEMESFKRLWEALPSVVEEGSLPQSPTSVILFLIPQPDKQAKELIGETKNHHLSKMIKTVLSYPPTQSEVKAIAIAVLEKAMDKLGKENIREAEFRKEIIKLALNHFHPALHSEEIKNIIGYLSAKEWGKKFYTSREKIKLLLTLFSQDENYLIKLNEILPHLNREDWGSILKLSTYVIPNIAKNPVDVLPPSVKDQTTLKEFVHQLRINDPFLKKSFLPVITMIGEKIGFEEAHKLLLWYGHLEKTLPRYREIFTSFFKAYFEDPQSYRRKRYKGFNPPLELKSAWVENVEGPLLSPNATIKTKRWAEISSSYNQAVKDLEAHLEEHLLHAGELGKAVLAGLLKEAQSNPELEKAREALEKLKALPHSSYGESKDVQQLKHYVASIAEELKAGLNAYLHSYGKEYSKGEVQKVKRYIKGPLSRDINRIINVFNSGPTTTKLTFSFTDDAWDLFNMGKSSTISSCQAYDYPGSYKIGLLGAIANPWVKMAEIKGNGEILARAKLYLLTDGKSYYVKVDHFYGDPRLVERLKGRLQRMLENWMRQGIIKAYILPDASQVLGKEKPTGPFRAPIYTDVGCCGGKGIVNPKG